MRKKELRTAVRQLHKEQAEVLAASQECINQRDAVVRDLARVTAECDSLIDERDQALMEIRRLQRTQTVPGGTIAKVAKRAVKKAKKK